MTIVKLQPISVVFTAPEEEVPADQQSARRRRRCRSTALSSDGLKMLSQGSCRSSTTRSIRRAATIRMKATFENKDNVLWPGLSVSTRLLVDTLKQVDRRARRARLSAAPTASMPIVVGADNKVEMQRHQGQPGGRRAIASSRKGLSPGEKVVVGRPISIAARLVGRADRSATSSRRRLKQTAAQNAPAKAP